VFVCRRIILLESLQVSLHRLWIGLLIEFGSKTTISKTLQKINLLYLCFIAVDFFHSCYHRLKMSSFSLEKTDFGQSIWPAGNQRNHCVYDSKLPRTRVLKEFLAQGWQQSLWKFRDSHNQKPVSPTHSSVSPTLIIIRVVPMNNTYN